MSSIPSAVNLHINTSLMYNHKQVKVENLHRKKQDNIDDFYRVKLQDYQLNKTHLKDYEMVKHMEDINRYMNLKRSVDFGLYKYSKYLGRTIDVTV